MITRRSRTCPPGGAGGDSRPQPGSAGSPPRCSRSCAEEAGGRDQATIRTCRRASGLPASKTLDAWEPDRSGIPAATQQALRTLEWIDRHEVVCVCGPSGTGKSHFIEALGHHAIDSGRTVAWHTQRHSRKLLRRHRADDSVNKAIGKLIRVDLVVIDDVGLLPISADAAEALFRVLDAAYEKRSIAISSNIHPSGFDELMPKSLATATVERLLHHAHVLITDGQDSYRLAQATAGKGVQPPTGNTTNQSISWWGGGSLARTGKSRSSEQPGAHDCGLGARTGRRPPLQLADETPARRLSLLPGGCTKVTPLEPHPCGARRLLAADSPQMARRRAPVSVRLTSCSVRAVEPQRPE